MPSPTQQQGGLAEDQAILFLQKRGFTILDRHVTSRYGEIDILARDGDVLVAVEVKARRSARFGAAIESVTKQKLARIILALQDWQQRTGAPEQQMRIDVVAIDHHKIKHLIGVEK